MRNLLKTGCALVTITILTSGCVTSKSSLRPLHPGLDRYVQDATREFGKIDQDHRTKLNKLAGYVSDKLSEGELVNLNFICTHNSRRSQMSQIWAQAAAWRYGLDNVKAWSGGTEGTAFNPRAVRAIRAAGFTVEKKNNAKNPLYEVTYAKGAPPITAFSKKYDHILNPSSNFCAVMTCGDADEKCPDVRGCDERVPLTFVDPKAFDGTDQEEAKYNERCRQIAREMLYLFSRVKVN